MTRQRVVFVLIGVIVLAALIGGLNMRRLFIDAARVDLEGRGLHWFDLLGTRIPCHGVFDIGVSVIFQGRPNGEFISGRLCRPADRASQWNLYSDPASARAGVPEK